MYSRRVNWAARYTMTSFQLIVLRASSMRAHNATLASFVGMPQCPQQKLVRRSGRRMSPNELREDCQHLGIRIRRLRTLVDIELDRERPGVDRPEGCD